MSIRITFTTALLLVLSWSLPAKAQMWTICNKDSEEAVVAIAYAIPGSFRVFSEGWWTIKACRCANVLRRSDTSDPSTAFMYVKNPKGQAVIEGRTPFCVAGHRFAIKGNDNCAKRGFQVARFDRTEINLSRDHTTNLRPPAGRRATCID